MAKRIFDILTSLIALLIFLPFGLIIAVILRFTGEGEIFFLQNRVGFRGEKFRLIKFSTMLKDSPKTGTITDENDPRILPVGRYLRITKVNEVPQLLNVLKGDMSIVGPRPLAAGEFALYSDDVKETIGRIQPGLTGLGSIVFRNEERLLRMSEKGKERFYAEDIIPVKGDMEKWYYDHRSFWLDMKIIVATAALVLFPRSQVHFRLLPIKSLLQASPLRSFYGL